MFDPMRKYRYRVRILYRVWVEMLNRPYALPDWFRAYERFGKLLGNVGMMTFKGALCVYGLDIPSEVMLERFVIRPEPRELFLVDLEDDSEVLFRIVFDET